VIEGDSLVDHPVIDVRIKPLVRLGRQWDNEKGGRSHSYPHASPSLEEWGLGFHSFPGQSSVTALPLIPVSLGSGPRK